MSGSINWNYSRTDRMKNNTDEDSRHQELCNRLNSEINSGGLPFLSLDYWDDLQKDLTRLDPFLKQFHHLLLLGIGGSSLGARALQQAFFPGQNMPGHQGPWLWIGDNVCSTSLEGWMKKLPAEKTMVLVVSKSGGTIETISQYLLIKRWMEQALGKSWKDNFMFITDPAQGFLRQEAEKYSIKTMSVPENLGGRYSVLSAVGLVPARFLNLDVSRLMQGALDMASIPSSGKMTADQLKKFPGYRLASWAFDLMNSGYSQLIFFVYLPLWSQFGNWFAQLWAESIGKNGLGSMPLPATGVSDQHSLQQMFLDGPRDKGCLFLTARTMPQGPEFNEMPQLFYYLSGKTFGDLLEAESLGTMMALTRQDVPLININLEDSSLYSAGKLIVMLEVMTLLTGWMMDINPLDQPAVELGKRLAKARLGADGLEKEKQQLSQFIISPESAEEF